MSIIRIFSQAIIAIAVSGGAFASGPDLFDDVSNNPYVGLSNKDKKVTAEIDNDRKVIARSNKKLRFLLDDSAKEINLNLFTGVSINSVMKRTQHLADGAVVWEGRHGNDQRDDDNSATLVQRNGRITGNVRIKGELYRIEPLSTGEHVVTKINPDAFGPDHGPGYAKLEQDSRFQSPHMDATATTGTTVPAGGVATEVKATPEITVMVNYTQDVTAAYTDVLAHIDLAIAETNAGYANSGVNAKVKLLSAEQVTYVESGLSVTDKDRYVGKTDGYLDAIHAKRDQLGADVGILMVNTLDGCGIAGQIGAIAENGYAVVKASCATGNYSFGHEIGHLFGARHDPYQDSTATPYAYGHGYSSPKNNWRTIMAYSCAGISVGCPRINYWSNPLKTYTDDQSMGSKDLSDNARVLNDRASALAAFKSVPVVVPAAPVVPVPVTFANETDFDIPDNNSSGISSAVKVTSTGVAGTVKVAVNIVHGYVGDLVLDLISPSGTVFNLQNRSGKGANNIVSTYSVNAGNTAATGTWKLRVKDLASSDKGYINSWSMTLTR